MALNVNDRLHGFKILSKREVPDVSAVLYEMEHEKSGAALVYIDREDANKTFSIGFTTIPEDDTGVFHILEHSVLCGSDKYPVKEPFVELLKTSLSTFLNAMTYNDKTVYPVCSRNEKDFLNLISVYMDAVFHPSMLTEERIFKQEGWHYELDGEELTCNGVVYNEMKGAYSQVDNLSSELIMDLLYPDSPYAKDSGGDPEFIPELTYGQFVQAHARYYHPSNSKTVLDGTMDISKVLALLDSYLAEYDRKEMNVRVPEPKEPTPSHARAEFEVCEGDCETKGRLLIGYRTCDCDQTERMLAIALIKDTLAGSNEAPLKKALIDSGLCRDLIIYELGGIIKNSIVIEARDVREEDAPKIEELINATLKEQIALGLDREMLRANLNLCEFRFREMDNGSYPRGLMCALSVYDTWLYGKDPAIPLCFCEVLDSLRAKLDTDYYERLAEEVLIDNESRASLIMVPSATVAQERAARTKAGLAAIKAKMSPQELAKIKEELEDFKLWQAREDTEEQLATLPTLELSDISTEVERIPNEISKNDGAKVLYHPINTGGIIYSSLVFDVSDLTPHELMTLSLMSNAMLNIKTSKSDVLSLQKRIKSSLGVFSPIVTQYATRDHSAMPAFVLKAHALERNGPEIAPIVEEVLYTTDFTDRQALRTVISQIMIYAQESMIADGHLLAMNRASAHRSVSGAISEYVDGYEAYLFLKKLDSDFDALADGVIADMQALCRRVFVKERLTLNLSCDRNGALVDSLLASVRSGKGAGERAIAPLPEANEAIMIPSPVAYAAIANDLYRVADVYRGSYQVACTILNFAHLWNSVRVQGGAYGAGAVLRASGRAAFYSYRDPSPKRTLDCFRESAAFLRAFVKENPDLTKLIIGAAGKATAALTPRAATEAALANYISGTGYDDLCRILDQMIHTTPEDVVAIADIIERIADGGSVCVVGGKELIDTLGDEIGAVLEM